MSQPQPIISVTVVLADGTISTFDNDDMAPGAYYQVSRNHNKPGPREQAETWIQHEIHFLTDREPRDTWKKRLGGD